MAYGVVQYLSSPDFRRLMDELLARRTDLPITMVEGGMAVLPDQLVHLLRGGALHAGQHVGDLRPLGLTPAS
jgi:hypothetical protein